MRPWRSFARVHPDRIVESVLPPAGARRCSRSSRWPAPLLRSSATRHPWARSPTCRPRSLPIFTHYGVDQSDHERLTTILDDDLGPEAIDLVIDDASHRFEETRASFETLFPRLAPGGTYVIEDWNWQLRLSYALAHPPATPAELEGDESLRTYFRENIRPVSLEALALQLVLVRACSRSVVTDVFIDESRVVITRGDAQLDPNTFRISDHFADPHGILGIGTDERAG